MLGFHSLEVTGLSEISPNNGLETLRRTVVELASENASLRREFKKRHRANGRNLALLLERVESQR